MTTPTFMLFAYGTLNKPNAITTVLKDCERTGTAIVQGTLYNIDGNYAVLMMYGDTKVEGALWRCPVTVLPEIDAYKGVAKGLFRRIGANAAETDGGIAETPCWIYVAGPALAHKLTPDARVRNDARNG